MEVICSAANFSMTEKWRSIATEYIPWVLYLHKEVWPHCIRKSLFFPYKHALICIQEQIAFCIGALNLTAQGFISQGQNLLFKIAEKTAKWAEYKEYWFPLYTKYIHTNI